MHIVNSKSKIILYVFFENGLLRTLKLFHKMRMVRHMDRVSTN